MTKYFEPNLLIHLLIENSQIFIEMIRLDKINQYTYKLLFISWCSIIEIKTEN